MTNSIRDIDYKEGKDMWYIKFCLICLIINLIADIIMEHETGVGASLSKITIITFIPLLGVLFTLLSLFIIISTPIEKLTRKDEKE